MESLYRAENDSLLLLPSLRLFIPPLRLVSAAMWQVVQRGSVQDYGTVEEFVSTVSEIVPELLNADQKAQLLLGLRARVVLELCRAEQIRDTETIELHLERIRALVSTWAAQPCFAEVEFPESNFVDQIELLLKDADEKEKFFQDVFPVDFGPEYDSALQVLMLDFLSRLEKLLPVPDIQQTASMLGAAPSALEECVHSLEKVVIDGEQLQPAPEQLQGCVTVQVEGETVTLLDYIQIQPPPGPGEPDDDEEEEEEDEVNEEEAGDALTPAAFQPLKRSTKLQLKRNAAEETETDAASAKRQRKKYSADKTCPVCNKLFLRAAAMRRHQETHSSNREFKYKCADCDKRFRDQYDMNRHSMRVHEKDGADGGAKEEDEAAEGAGAGGADGSENKNCALCGKYFGRRVDMERHMRSHSEERPYDCCFCEKKFKNPYVLKRHQQEICKSRELKRPKKREAPRAKPPPPPSAPPEGPAEGKVCPICSRVLPCTADIAKHLRSHTEERPFVCVGCEKGFKYRDTLKKHQIIHGHHGVREEPSKTAEQILAEADAERRDADAAEAAETAAVKTLNRHVQSHTEERPFHCVHCKRRFKHMHGLKRHQVYAVCHKKINRFPWKKEPGAGPSGDAAPGGGGGGGDGDPPMIPVWCSNCGQHFEYPAALKQHQEDVCRPEASGATRCADCGTEFKSVTMLKVHRRIHDPLYCAECGKILASEAGFERHKLMHRPMQCTMCDEAFTLLRRLREHYDKRHAFAGPYPCEQCGKTFAQLSYLAIHQRIHKGEFPYACAACPEKFRSSNCLTVHRRKHTGEKPFLCWQCGKRYRSASELTVHMGTHSEARPWACAQCAAAYRTKPQLANHVEQGYACEECGAAFLHKKSLWEHSLCHDVKAEPAFTGDVRIEFQ
ncbi:Zinc finger protein 91 [Liparis tanakae]|uniref:Zinc finger protein 91 n=1 Tax=Liparis tanakae TaxID=230148 RepID=A0A4Z2FJ38_9TELE|nr:Zinc finger protein 91 [Liparis tanakae]